MNSNKEAWQFLFFFLIAKTFVAQSYSGEVVYAQTLSWSKISAALPFLSPEERDRITISYGKFRGESEKFKLLFNDSSSYYTYLINDKYEESNWSSKKSELQLFYNFTQNTSVSRIGLLGKNYLIKDEIPKWKWKVLGEIKEVSGYVCMKAQTMDTIKSQKIEAWFTDKILVPSGPWEFNGLPGLILELNINDGSSIITATQINLESHENIPKLKLKGKEISYNNYRSLIHTYIQDCIERRRNPFWELRY